MLPVLEPDGRRTFAQIVLSSLILIPVSVIPVFLDRSGLVYCAGALMAGLVLFWFGRRLQTTHSLMDAQHLLRATVIYLPVLLLLIVVDATF